MSGIGRVAGAFLLLCAFCWPAVAKPRIALIIANSAYTGGVAPIPFAVNDGKLIAQTLQKLGFSVTLASDVDLASIKQAISQFGHDLQQAGPSTTGLFYYAGQGVRIDGQSYVIPVNGSFRRAADFETGALPAKSVLQQMQSADVETGIIIIDASRDSPFPGHRIDPSEWTSDLPRQFFVAQSTSPGEVSMDGDGPNSPFATVLAAEMVKPGRAIEEVIMNVRKQVMRVTAQRQVPWDSSALVTPFYFASAAP